MTKYLSQRDSGKGGFLFGLKVHRLVKALGLGVGSRRLVNLCPLSASGGERWMLMLRDHSERGFPSPQNLSGHALTGIARNVSFRSFGIKLTMNVIHGMSLRKPKEASQLGERGWAAESCEG